MIDLVRPKMAIEAAIAASVVFATPAFARSPVNNWFCKSLRPPFDAAAVIAAFPLQKLPPAIETRVEKEKDGEDYKVVDVEIGSESDEYEVRYSYSFKTNDVGDPYGFTLRFFVQYPLSEKIKPEMDKWLAELGKPERSSLGRAVYAGPEIYEGGEPAFSFERWGSSAMYSANWWSKGDMKYAADLCK
jgi:hypothetical protein